MSNIASNPPNSLNSQSKDTLFKTNIEITGETLLNEALDKIDFLIEDLIPRTGLGSLAGSSDLGKSTILRQLGIEICSGNSSFLGFNLNAIHKSVIIVSSEDDRTSIAHSLKKQTIKIKPHQIRNLRFIFDFEELITELDEKLTSMPADLVIIDCFSDVFGGDLKDTTKIRAFLNQYQKLIAKHNCYILFLHHTSKRTEGLEPSKNNLLSGQGFEAKMRLVIELRMDVMDNRYRHLCIVKANGLPAKMKKESFVLQFLEEELTFLDTGDRVPFELLAKAADDGGKAKFQQARDLHKGGHSYEKIAELMGYKSKASISALFKRAETNGWI